MPSPRLSPRPLRCGMRMLFAGLYHTGTRGCRPHTARTAHTACILGFMPRCRTQPKDLTRSDVVTCSATGASGLMDAPERTCPGALCAPCAPRRQQPPMLQSNKVRNSCSVTLPLAPFAVIPQQKLLLRAHTDTKHIVRILRIGKICEMCCQKLINFLRFFSNSEMKNLSCLPKINFFAIFSGFALLQRK